MIRAEQIREILALYRRHGWTLRRVLLTDSARVAFNDLLQELFGGAQIVTSSIDAVWFSRAARPDRETWELRRLSENPFALMEIFDEEDDEEVREETLAEIEARMKEI